MIKIEHPILMDISKEYSENIKSLLLSKVDDVLKVISILQSSELATENTVSKKVNNFTSAIKVVVGRDKLLDSKYPNGDGKKTNDLIFTLNNFKIKFDKRSKCKRNKKYEDIVFKARILWKFINNNDIIGSKPKDLLILNERLKTEIGILPKKVYNYFFDYNNYYNQIDIGIGKALDLKCCPYCNRNFITYIPDKNKRVIGPTYDHFFSKARYEYLTLSFYNLIPSCYICNCNLKLNTDFNLKYHLHPYLGEFGNDVFFDFELTTMDYNKKKEICFSPILKTSNTINSDKEKRIFGETSIKNSGSINVFKLKDIYESHSDSIEEIYEKFSKESPYYIGSISKIIKKLKTSEEELYRFYFRNYYNSTDFNKRPLSKLDRDIYDKLKFIFDSTTNS